MASPKPTLLAFHGSGSNSTIHTIQMARLSRFLRPHFDIESLSGPLESAPGPGILPFFEGCGPYYRWVPPAEAVSVEKLKEAGTPAAQMLPELETFIKSEIAKANAKGSKVVGVVGFSQGTRIVAGLMQALQIRKELLEQGKGAELEWLEDVKFGLSMCTSFPPAILPGSAVEAVKSSGMDESKQKEMLEAKISVPTLHVLGKQDEWRWAGKTLIEAAFDIDAEPKGNVGKGTSGMYEFEMGHHYPVHAEDTQKVADWIVGTWEGGKAA